MENLLLDGVFFKVGKQLEGFNCIVTSINNGGNYYHIEFEHIFASSDEEGKYFGIFIEDEFISFTDEFGNGHTYREGMHIKDFINNYMVSYECYEGETCSISHLFYKDEELDFDLEEDFLV